jgi:hypothetical protein
MTRTEAARKLFRLGPLTTAAFVEITGWPRSTCNWILAQLRKAGDIRMARRGFYEVAR